ncbi:MAG: FAD-dependent oxidoreductase [Myxococcota bacterium]|nr:FAD-dependent oxidoreductase [Myxococcota bacterium]
MNTRQPVVAVIGAGISGSMCAHRLTADGCQVTVFDKGRGPGGRMATRRTNEYQVDHGAPYFTCHASMFQPFVDRWLDKGVAAIWPGPFVAIHLGEKPTPLPEETRYVGLPGMSAITRDLLSKSDCRFDTVVNKISRQRGDFYVEFAEQPAAGPYDVLVIATPPAPALEIAGDISPLITNATGATMLSCWTTVVAFASPVDVPFAGASIQGGPLSWVGRDSSKPGRNRAKDVWVLQANAAWSQLNLGKSKAFVSEALLRAFEEVTCQKDLSPQYLFTHRWRSARPQHSSQLGSLFSEDERIGFCGDWLADGRVASAALSGFDLAERILTLGRSSI